MVGRLGELVSLLQRTRASARHIAILSIMGLTALRGTEDTSPGVMETTTQSRDQPKVNFMLAYAPKDVDLKVV
jgi:hypothetical protein